MALAETLNEDFDPFKSIGKVAGGKDIRTRAATARREFEPAARAESAAREAATLAETQARRDKAQAETMAEEGFAKEKRKTVEEFQANIPERPMFNPTQFDRAAAAQMAGLTAVIGAIVGGGRARAALKSMEGFTRGAKEGRADLYDREVKQFEQDLSGWKDNLVLAKDKVNQVIDLLSTDRGAALAKAKELDPLLQDGVAKAKNRQQDFTGLANLLNSASKAGDELEVAFAKAVNKKRADLPADLAKTYNALAPNYERFNRLNNTKNASFFRVVPNEIASRALMKAVEVDLTPKLTEFLSEKFNVTQDQIIWWKEYDQFVAKVRNELFGATLTRAEKENFDRTIITPATEPKTAQRFFEEQVQVINNAVRREINKGVARGVDQDIISAYLGVELGATKGAGAEQLSEIDRQALEYATSNPDDPRSAQILQRLGR
jgi:hypothetical protein